MPRFPGGLETERGTAGVRSVAGILDTLEETVELRWPNDVVVYDNMRRTDAQVASTLRAINLPLRRTRWSVVGDDVDERIIAFIQDELGLNPDRRGRRRRRREGIVFDETLTTALLMLPFGHSVFEQVYRVGPPGPDVEGLPSRLAHLRKLAPRLPRTISGWDVAGDGGLEGIRQYVIDDNGLAKEVQLGIDRLVVFVNEREGADWTGNSILRSAYKHWLIKDVLIRIGPMAVERNGMGLPVVTYPAGGSKEEALDIARRARAGDEAGVAKPEGWSFELVGVTGTVRDELPLLKYHDQAIGRNALAMFLDLGHDRGARSLGDTFVDVFVDSLNAVADAICETVTEHVIRDLVELNFGTDEAYPELVAEELTPEGNIAAEALKQLVEAGVVTPDDELEDHQRRIYGLPERTLDDVGEPPGLPGELLPDGRVLTPGGPVDPNAIPPGEERIDDVPVAARGDLARRARRLAALLEG